MRADFNGLEQKLTDMIKLKYGDDASTNQVFKNFFGLCVYTFPNTVGVVLIWAHDEFGINLCSIN